MGQLGRLSEGGGQGNVFSTLSLLLNYYYYTVCTLVWNYHDR
jgi:hypothetical protein